MKVLLLCRYDRSGASSRLRSFQYIPYLEKHGIDVTALPLFDSDYLEQLYRKRNNKLGDGTDSSVTQSEVPLNLNEKNVCRIMRMYWHRLCRIFKAGSYDIVWIEKELFPWLPAWGECALKSFGVPYIVDYDDAIFHRYDQHRSALVRLFLGEKIASIMRNAALVIAGNKYLADYAEVAGARNVVTIPTVVDLERYCEGADTRRSSEMPTIGWIGSPATALYLQPLHDLLAQVVKTMGARLVLVGAGGNALSGVPVELHNWSEESEVSEIMDFDIGIMPLPGEPYECGKCGYKLIQYMACRKPSIASPVGVNKSLIINGENGYLAGTSLEWENALRDLLLDEAMRARMGDFGRKMVEQEYSLAVTAPKILRLLEEVSQRKMLTKKEGR